MRAEANVRALYQQAKAVGFNALVSSPAENKSGSGSLSATPKPLTEPGQYGTIPAGAPAVGHNTTDDHLWYVNAYPVDGVNFGLRNLSFTYLGGPPTFILTGPNQGSNLGIATLFSGTVGAAVAGAKAGIPAIAFSGSSGKAHSYTGLQPGDYSFVYADAALRLVDALIAAGAPYLPSGTVLNVNFPDAGPGTDCATAADVKFVLSRIYAVLGFPIDVNNCGKNSLPSEKSVVDMGGCYASVSVMNASDKLDVGKTVQAQILGKLAGFLSCLPS